MDGGSTDRTVEIAESTGARVLCLGTPLLESRRIGIESSHADVILLLDSDQLLQPRTLWRVAEKMRLYDMLVLEERASSRRGTLRRLYDSDRVVVQSRARCWDPITGVAMPRAYRSDLLKKAVERIPKSLNRIRYPDHAILYFEASQLSSSVGMVENAILHEENTRLLALLRKHFSYGMDAAHVVQEERYRGLIRGKARARQIPEDGHQRGDWMRAQVLLGMKAVPYLAGFYLASRSRAGSRMTRC
jgi:glycosyltransferase involved in cell wall biosynthesis